MDEGTFSLSFQPAELAFLVELLELPNAFDRTASTAENTLSVQNRNTVQAALAERQYVQVQPDGRVGIDAVVAALLGVVAWAESYLTLIVESPQGGWSGRRCLYHAAGLTVEHEHAADGTHHLTALRNHSVALQRMIDLMDIEIATALSLAPLTIEEAELREARLIAAVEGEGACMLFLESTGIDHQPAQVLAADMAFPICWGSLQSWEHAQEAYQRRDQLGFLAGQERMWLLREHEMQVVVAPGNKEELLQRVGELISALIPKESGISTPAGLSVHVRA